MKIMKINKEGSIGVVLPKELKEDYGWTPGTKLSFVKDLKNKTITIFAKI